MKGPSTHASRLSTFHFFYTLFFICLGYWAFEYILVNMELLSADEFVFARHIYEYTYHLPYRDFAPYKTVLGYYLFSIPMYFSHGLLAPLFYIKDEIALVNLACIAISCTYARRYFSDNAIFITLLAILANQLFMVYSTDLRVDMLTAWFCLFSILALLDKRFRLAGFLQGVAFLISQKSLWYFVAINGALLFCRFLFSTPTYAFRHLIRFNFATILTICVYITVWSLASSPSIVLHNLFYEAYIQAGIQWYMPIYFSCWQIILYRGPALYLLWPLTFISLYRQSSTDFRYQRRVFLIACSSLALLFIINYKQAFPYNSVFTIPALFVLYGVFFDWLFSQKSSLNKSTYSRQYLICMGMYSLAIFLFIYAFELPAINFLLTLVPLLLCYKQHAKMAYQIALAIFVVTGIVYPGMITFIVSSKLDGTYQREMLILTDKIIKNDEGYVGGIPYLYQKDQPIVGMKNLIGPALDYLYEPKAELKPLLLPSLYLDVSSQEEVIHAFETHPVKVLISNYRMLSLPPKINDYISQHYQHYYGSLFVYAPIIHPKELNFYLTFTGQYRVDCAQHGIIKIDGNRIRQGQRVNLKAGNHTNETQTTYRLALLPDIDKSLLRTEYQTNHYLRMLKAIML